jgi:glycine cleavage system T protein
MMEWQDDIFEFSREAAADLVPSLNGVGLTRKINGMFSFTPDGMPLLGESPNVRGFWLAEAIWITHSGGAGKAVAEWIVDGNPSSDLRECDIGRFHPYATTPSYIRNRGSQQFREVYDIIHPQQQMDEPRNIRKTPYHQRFVELGAEFFENAGWERPQWFGANETLLEGRPAGPDRNGWAKRYWSAIIGAEHRATREAVALFDLTPFTKLEVTGKGALSYLQHLTSNNMEKPEGKITYTSMLDYRGGIKCDLTVTRIASNRFLVITGGSTGIMDLQWMKRNVLDHGEVQITDISSKWCCVGIWGPNARALVSKTTDSDLPNNAFPYMTARWIMVGNVPTFAQRISYVGEMGWEIYAPMEFGLRLWDTLWEVGQPLGLIAAGGGAFDTLRLEKGYRLWGNDIHTEYNPYEAGIDFTIRLDNGKFIGCDALNRIKGDGVSKKLSCLTLVDSTVALMGKEPVYLGKDIVGYVTSAGYGYTVGQSVAYSYLPLEQAHVGTTVDIEYIGIRHKAKVMQEPLFDTRNSRLRS